MRIGFILFVSLISFFKIDAQSSFYDTEVIQEIRIYFENPNWDQVLDSLYIDGNENRLLGSLTINGEVFDSVGIRYKGFSSVSVDRSKNPFNIKLDYVKNHDYNGVDKLKLGNVIQDPSFLREVLSYEIARKYMPASLANYAEVFINDVYWGLYTNIESVNKDFAEKHFNSRENSFFKCNPESLDFDGENANLGNSPGVDSTNYYTLYEKRSDYGWSDLYEFIDLLNEEPENVEALLNIDRSLWMHAFNYALINFDSYVGYAQNYYLYQDDNDQFNPILWDLNMSFASFRFADASEFYDGFTIGQAKVMDPLMHYNNVSVYPRPLMRNLFNNETYRRMYIAHLRTILEENFVNDNYKTRGLALQNLIDNSVEADTNKFYTYQDFIDNFEVTTTDLIDYPGIVDLMDSRKTFLETYPGYQGAPTVSNLTYLPGANNEPDISIVATVDNATSVILKYRYAAGDLFQTLEMYDDGNHSDTAPNDGIYGVNLEDFTNYVEYYIYAENDVAGRFSPERAAYEFHTIEVPLESFTVRINEIMASNESAIADEFGEYDDWIELYNTTNSTISLQGFILTDSIDEWVLPNIAIGADQYLIIWADDDTEQGDLHTNFKLSAAGESLKLMDPSNTYLIDEVSFPEQTTDIAFARIPNGDGAFQQNFPTPGWNNEQMVNTDEIKSTTTFELFPNPADQHLHLQFSRSNNYHISISDINGKVIHQLNLEEQSFAEIDVAALISGVYFIQINDGTSITSQKFAIQK